MEDRRAKVRGDHSDVWFRIFERFRKRAGARGKIEKSIGRFWGDGLRGDGAPPAVLAEGEKTVQKIVARGNLAED